MPKKINIKKINVLTLQDSTLDILLKYTFRPEYKKEKLYTLVSWRACAVNDNNKYDIGW